MLNLKDFNGILNELAPIELSFKCISRGDYDNSGIVIASKKEVKKVLFTLDLTALAVNRAKRLGCDTIITHHPAIYAPVKSLDAEGENATILLAIEKGLNVISMHLNLDMADGGIDASLCRGLGGEKYKILDLLEEGVGYGREFPIAERKFGEFLRSIKKEFKTDKVIGYGNRNSKVKKVASFCGSGGSTVIKLLSQDKILADTVVTSDIAHHVIKELIEKDKKIVILTHYASEEYGFRKFYEKIKEKTENKIECFYLDDKRFR